MNTPDTNWTPEQAAALQTLRMRWALTLMVIVPLPFIALLLTGSDWLEQMPDSAAQNAMWAAVFVGGGSLLGGLFARNQAYKAAWQGEVIAPDGYIKGNTLFFGAIAIGAAGLFVISVLAGYPSPTFAAAPIFVGLLIFNFPNGRPMEPTPPRLGNDGDAL